MRLAVLLAAALMTVPAAAQTPPARAAAPAPNQTNAARPQPNAPEVSAAPGAPDPYQWLEPYRDPRALAQVEQWNRRTVSDLEADPRFARWQEQLLTILQASDRIAYPAQRGEHIDNFWRDETNTHGLWRRTTLDSYRSASPRWETVLDLDALSREEGKNWVWGGADCLQPTYDRCLVSVSDGGQDADVVREYDPNARRFVQGGFSLPEGKQNVSWLDRDTLLVAREWGPGTLTASGYPFVLRRVARGAPLDSGPEVFRGQPTDVSVSPSVLRDPDGRVRAVMAVRSVSFFESEFHVLRDDGRNLRIPVPAKSSLQGYIDGQVVFSLEEPWTVAGQTFPTGALVSFDIDQFVARPDQVRPTLVYAPGARESVEGVTSTRNRLLVTLYENVRGRVYSFRHADGRWTRERVPLPDNAGVRVVSASDETDRFFVNVASFLQPDTLYMADADTTRSEVVRTLPARFDAANLVTEQFEATSSDGTRVPYFVVRRRDVPLNGNNPTLLYAYGGFQVSMTPGYSGGLGRVWLENGGVYVLANIRGGGEFGPDWHQAGLNVNRQRIYDDFAAVAQDLTTRGITSPRRLGIRGGSNGGLLTGVQLTQRPDLYNAVVIQVPLLDMLNFERIGAGASWVGEYGTPSNPAQREFLARISPYHNVRADRRYPTPMIMTSTNDDRVGPSHARKLAARMEALGLPFYYYEDTAGGHSGDANLRQVARESAMMYVYLARRLMD